jgi:IS5 family transposase
MQTSFAALEFLSNPKKTRKEVFLKKMEEIIPFDDWCRIIEPYYPKAGNGRKPYPIQTMLRMYLISQWYSTSDIETEELVIENMPIRLFVGELSPDSTTLENFRHLLEKHNLNQLIFDDLRDRLTKSGVILNKGTIVDATLIAAPDSNKNKDKKANPNMGSTYKHNKHYFGLKSHTGMDETNGIVTAVVTTKANVSDVAVGNELLTGNEAKVWADAGYCGLDKREEVCEKFADGTGQTERVKVNGRNVDRLVKRNDVEFLINKKHKLVTTAEAKKIENEKSRTRVKVEWAFQKLKHIFKFRKTRLRTIEQNHNKLLMLYTLVNILTCSQKGIPVN